MDAPLEEIAATAGVSAGTLYNRFGGRDALIDAVMPDLVEAGGWTPAAGPRRRPIRGPTSGGM